MQKTAQASVQDVLPAPVLQRAGDFIFVSSIFPLDSQGNVVHSRSISPYIGEAEVAAQTRSCLEILKRALTAAGSSLDKVLRAEVYLAEASARPRSQPSQRAPARSHQASPASGSASPAPAVPVVAAPPTATRSTRM